MALMRSSGSGGSPGGEPVIVGESLNNFLNSGLSSNELLPFFLSVLSSDLDSKHQNNFISKKFGKENFYKSYFIPLRGFLGGGVPGGVAGSSFLSFFDQILVKSA